MKASYITVDLVREAANLLRGMGAAEVFAFGSTQSGRDTTGSDLDLAVRGLPHRRYFSAVSRTSELVGRPVGLVDLDDETPLVRHLRKSGELIRVG